MRKIVMLVLLAFAGEGMADPGPLEIPKSGRGRVSTVDFEAVHKEMTTGTSDLKAIQLAIVRGMLETKGRAWTYDGEGDGYILARFDYRGHTIVTRIEYDQNLVQVKYHGGSEAYQCENLQESGACFKNHKGFFNYTKNLRASIERNLKLLATGASL